MEEQNKALGSAKISMPMTPDGALVDCIRYSVHTYNSGIPPVIFQVQPVEISGDQRFIVTKYDGEEEETISNQFIRESGASRMALREARKLATQYSEKHGVLVEDLGDRDARELFCKMEEMTRQGSKPGLDRNKKAHDIHGNSLRTRWGLDDLR